jgi:hypothetical protein
LASELRSGSHRHYPLACDLLNATRCAARFFFFLARKASARLSAVAFCLGAFAAFVGVATGSGISVSGMVICLLHSGKLVAGAGDGLLAFESGTEVDYLASIPAV